MLPLSNYASSSHQATHLADPIKDNHLCCVPTSSGEPLQDNGFEWNGDHSFEENSVWEHGERILEAVKQVWPEAEWNNTTLETGSIESETLSTLQSNGMVRCRTSVLTILGQTMSQLSSSTVESFISEARQNSDMVSLMGELMSLLPEGVFREVATVIIKLWSERYLKWRSLINSNSGLTLPKYDCFIDSNLEQVDTVETLTSLNTSSYPNPSLSFRLTSQSEILSAANLNLESITKDLRANELSGSRLLHESAQAYRVLVLIQECSEALFLSLEGVFHRTTQEQSGLQSRMGSQMRSFDDEMDFGFGSEEEIKGWKRVKM